MCSLALLFLLSIGYAVGGQYGSQNQELLYSRTILAKNDDVVAFLRVSEINGTEDTDLKALFFPQVDNFAVLDVPESGSMYENKDDVYISLDINGVISSNRFYKKNDRPGLFVGFWTAVVNLRDGEITSIAWDDGCRECQEESCIDTRNCGLEYAEVDCENRPSICDFTVYLAWVGTDSNGEVCNSLCKSLDILRLTKASIPSKFQTFSLYPVYKSASGIPDRIMGF